MVEFSVILQSLIVAVLIGTGKLVWQTSIAIAELTAEFRAHTKSCDQAHAETRQALKELQGRRLRPTLQVVNPIDGNGQG
jgi:chaperone required for assembly of F1-ATPase